MTVTVSPRGCSAADDFVVNLPIKAPAFCTQNDQVEISCDNNYPFRILLSVFGFSALPFACAGWSWPEDCGTYYKKPGATSVARKRAVLNDT
jgi:hypothetical protein